MAFVDLITPAQNAVFRALAPLAGRDDLPVGLKVFQHVPQDTPPPYLMVGRLACDNAEEHGEQAEMITAEVIGVYRGNQRAELLAVMAAARAALDRQPIEDAGATLEPPRFQKLDAGEAIADGQTYVAMATFEFLATPA